MNRVKIDISKDADEYISIIEGNRKKILKFFNFVRFPRAKVDWKDKEKRMKDFRESFDKRMANGQF